LCVSVRVSLADEMRVKTILNILLIWGSQTVQWFSLSSPS
jgi:hypothetical protein